MKYKHYENYYFSETPASNVLGAAGTLPCMANNQEGSDTSLSELTPATALEPDLQAPSGSDMAFSC